MFTDQKISTKIKMKINKQIKRNEKKKLSKINLKFK
jgi:hypothetical protein